MRLAVVLLATAILSASAMPSAVAALSEPGDASKVVDRTLSCDVGLVGGIHQVYVQANVGTHVPGNRSAWRHLASAGVADRVLPYDYEYTLFVHYLLAGVSAGDPLRPDGFEPLPERLTYLPGSGCNATRSIAFSKSGLVARHVGALTDEYLSCVPGKHVLVRVRGVFVAPQRLKPVFFSAQTDPTVHLVAAGTVLRGEVAVRSGTGKPLAYAEVLQNGKARLFTARSCAP